MWPRKAIQGKNVRCMLTGTKSSRSLRSEPWCCLSRLLNADLQSQLTVWITFKIQAHVLFQETLWGLSLFFPSSLPPSLLSFFPPPLSFKQNLTPGNSYSIFCALQISSLLFCFYVSFWVGIDLSLESTKIKLAGLKFGNTVRSGSYEEASFHI